MNKITFNLLTSEQQFWYASIMIDLILADGVVHVSEQAYLQWVFDLFQKNPEELEKLKAKAKKGSPEKILPVSGISSETATLILQDCISIAIADAEFHEKEQDLLYEIGQQLELDQTMIEKAISKGQQQLAHIFAFAG